MHKFLPLRLMSIFLILVLFNSCSGNDSGSFNFVSFELDGVLWESGDASITATQSSNTFILTLVAFNSNGERVQLEILEFNAPRIGTFVIAPASQHNVLYSSSGQLDQNTLNALSCPNVEGDITITNIDDISFSGTFQANVCGVAGQRIIRNGIFNNVLIQ
ncbi:MAG: DUF6252 family protein [Microscillaceae bacterium]|nr:DUF6252 family protein [Microscillaceae bacterium]